MLNDVKCNPPKWEYASTSIWLPPATHFYSADFGRACWYSLWTASRTIFSSRCHSGVANSKEFLGELRQCPSLQTWGNMLKPLTPWKIHEKTMKRTESNQQALTVSCCKFIQMQKGIPSFVQAQCTISWLHIGDKIASTFLVSHLTFISKLCGFNISRQKNWKLRNWGILWLRKTQWDPEVVTGNAGNGQQVAPRVEIPTKSLRSKLQGTAMLQHRFQGHLLGWWRWCSRGDFGWWPVDPWKICKFIEWKFRDMFVVIGNHRFNMFQFIS